MKTPIEITDPVSTITPSTTSLRAPMKQLSSTITGSACSGSSTPPMPAPPEMWQFLPICAHEPTVAHVSTIVPEVDIGADIDEGRHQHDVGRDEGRAAHDAAGHGAEAGGAEAVVVPAGEFRRHLVEPGRWAARGVDGAAGHRRRIVEAEGQQHRLLEPLVDLPLAAGLLGHAQLAVVERVERGVDRLAHGAFG